MGHSARVVPFVVTTGVALVLAGAAIATVDQASCDVPSHYVMSHDEVQLVGGCLQPEDLPVAPPAPDDPGHPPNNAADEGGQVPMGT